MIELPELILIGCADDQQATGGKIGNGGGIAGHFDFIGKNDAHWGQGVVDEAVELGGVKTMLVDIPGIKMKNVPPFPDR